MLPGPPAEENVTRYREPVESERFLVAFLIYCGNSICSQGGGQPTLGAITVPVFVKEVSRLLREHFREQVSFPTSAVDVHKAMDRFKDIAGLPHFVDSTHIEWHRCPSEHHYEYRFYKGYTSLIMFAVCTADRRVVYV